MGRTSGRRRSARFSDLGEEDKQKLSKLMQSLIQLGREKDYAEKLLVQQRTLFENRISALQKHNQRLLLETEELRAKFLLALGDSAPENWAVTASPGPVVIDYQTPKPGASIGISTVPSPQSSVGVQAEGKPGVKAASLEKTSTSMHSVGAQTRKGSSDLFVGDAPAPIGEPMPAQHLSPSRPAGKVGEVDSSTSMVSQARFAADDKLRRLMSIMTMGRKTDIESPVLPASRSWALSGSSADDDDEHSGGDSRGPKGRRPQHAGGAEREQHIASPPPPPPPPSRSLVRAVARDTASLHSKRGSEHASRGAAAAGSVAGSPPAGPGVSAAGAAANYEEDAHSLSFSSPELSFTDRAETEHGEGSQAQRRRSSAAVPSDVEGALLQPAASLYDLVEEIERRIQEEEEIEDNGGKPLELFSPSNHTARKHHRPPPVPPPLSPPHPPLRTPERDRELLKVLQDLNTG